MENITSTERIRVTLKLFQTFLVLWLSNKVLIILCVIFFSFPFSLLTELPMNMYVLGDAEYDV